MVDELPFWSFICKRSQGLMILQVLLQTLILFLLIIEGKLSSILNLEIIIQK